MNNQKLVYEGRIVSVSVGRATFPNRKRAQIETVHHPGGAAVVALDNKQRVCLLRQYRPVFHEWMWELPAGKLDPGEPPLATAQRELAEEAGIRADTWIPLGGVVSSPGVFTETVHLYLARDLSKTKLAHEEHELIEVHWVALAKAIERAGAGDINDGKTVAGLFRASRYIKGKRKTD
ncbi:MAG TPA: NUDIX hydrolase [Burkholderiales bacterium]